jgi:hypothetical protein
MLGITIEGRPSYFANLANIATLARWTSHHAGPPSRRSAEADHARIRAATCDVTITDLVEPYAKSFRGVTIASDREKDGVQPSQPSHSPPSPSQSHDCRTPSHLQGFCAAYQFTELDC